jgi:exodeoxyribonuclease VII small subunit
VQEGLKDFEKGMALAQSLRERLQDVEQKVETIKAKYKAAGESAA